MRKHVLGVLSVVLSAAVTAHAQDIVVVVSSDLAPYQEALAGVRDSLGPGVVVVNLAKSNHVPHSRVVITIGGQAALRPYAVDATIIYCVALGVILKPTHHRDRRIKISLSPAPATLLQKLKTLQPDVKRLGVLWSSESFEGYVTETTSEAQKLGLILESHRLKSSEDLPEALRALKNRADAFWLPPDPLLLTEQSFAAISKFSLLNKIPLYVSIDSLADKGATAAVFSSFRDMGHKAGDVAHRLLAGEPSIGDTIYVDRITLSVSDSYASKTGLSLSPAVRKEADRVIP